MKKTILIFVLGLFCFSLFSLEERTLLPSPRQFANLFFVDYLDMEYVYSFDWGLFTPLIRKNIQEGEFFPTLPKKQDKEQRQKLSALELLDLIESIRGADTDKQKIKTLENLLDEVEEARRKLEGDLQNYQFQIGMEKIRFESDLIQSWYMTKSMIESDILWGRFFPKYRPYRELSLLYYLYLLSLIER